MQLCPNMKTKLLIALALSALVAFTAGCPASMYAGDAWSSPPPNSAEITTDPIKAPTDMSNACGRAGYTVDDSYTPAFQFLRAPGDPDSHQVVFHCNDGSTPRS